MKPPDQPSGVSASRCCSTSRNFETLTGAMVTTLTPQRFQSSFTRWRLETKDASSVGSDSTPCVTDDGSVEGAVEPRFRAVHTLDEDFDEAACSNITTADRTRIQMVYVPSARDGESQVAAFLRGRLWRAISWSDEFQQVVMQRGKDMNEEFGQQLGVGAVGEAVRRRWEGLAGAHVQETPNFRPIDQRFEEFIPASRSIVRTGRGRSRARTCGTR